MTAQPINIGSVDITPGLGNPSVSIELGDHRQGSYSIDLWESNGDFLQHLDHGALSKGKSTNHQINASAAEMTGAYVSVEFIVAAVPTAPDPDGPFSITINVSQWSPNLETVHHAGSRSYSGVLDEHSQSDGVVVVQLN